MARADCSRRSFDGGARERLPSVDSRSTNHTQRAAQSQTSFGRRSNEPIRHKHAEANWEYWLNRNLVAAQGVPGPFASLEEITNDARAATHFVVLATPASYTVIPANTAERHVNFGRTCVITALIAKFLDDESCRAALRNLPYGSI